MSLPSRLHDLGQGLLPSHCKLTGGWKEVAWLRRWLGIRASLGAGCLDPLGLGTRLGVAVSIPSVGHVSRVLGSLGPPMSYDRDMNTRAEHVAPFKFYWTPFSLGLFTVPRMQPGGSSGEALSTLLLPTAPALSTDSREGERVGRR